MDSDNNAGASSEGQPESPQYALTDDGVLKVYSAGATTVLGFAGVEVPSEFNAAHYRAAIRDLLRSVSCDTVAFDLTGVPMVPSGMLGLLVSLRQLDELSLRVQVFNAGPEIRSVIAMTRLDTMIEVRDVEFD